MTSFKIELPARDRASARFMGRALRNLARAALGQMKRHKLSQSKAAAELGVDPAIVSRILKGGANPTLRTIGEIAWAFQLRPELTFHPIEQTGGNREPIHINIYQPGPAVMSQPAFKTKQATVRSNATTGTSTAKTNLRAELVGA